MKGAGVSGCAGGNSGAGVWGAGGNAGGGDNGDAVGAFKPEQFCAVFGSCEVDVRSALKMKLLICFPSL